MTIRKISRFRVFLGLTKSTLDKEEEQHIHNATKRLSADNRPPQYSTGLVLLSSNTM